MNPEQVVQLEEEWGDSLVESRQMDAAINHFIEAGSTKKALDAAIAARQWKKAMHIIQVIDDSDSVADYYKLLGEHFASTKVRLDICILRLRCFSLGFPYSGENVLSSWNVQASR